MKVIICDRCGGRLARHPDTRPDEGEEYDLCLDCRNIHKEHLKKI